MMIAVLMPEAGRTAAQDFTAAQIKSVKKQYAVKCGKCHKMHDPRKYKNEVWAEWFAKMSRKAVLPRDTMDRFSRHVDYLRSQNKSPAE